MYRTSAEQVFARMEWVRQRAAHLVSGDANRIAPVRTDDNDRETAAVAARVDLRLPRLCATFNLDALATDVLITLVAAEFDPYLRTAARGLQREFGRPWLELGTVAELLDLAPARIPELGQLFAPAGTFRHWALVLVDATDGPETPVVATRVKIAQRVAQFLIGDDRLPPGLRIIEPQATLEDTLVPPEALDAMVRRTRKALLDDSQLVLELTGPAGAGKKFVAEAIGAHFGLPLLLCDAAELERVELEGRLAELRREARLSGAIACLLHWDAHRPSAQPQSGLDEHGPPGEPPERRLLPQLARFLREAPGVVVLTAAEREPLVEQHAPHVASLTVPFPSPLERGRLLERALARHGATVVEEVDFSQVGRRFAIAPGGIEIAARAAIELAAEREGEPLVNRADLFEACKHQLRHDLASLAVRVTNAHKWEDLVINVEVYEGLREMIAYMRHAKQVYEQWGFGARHSLAQGLSALFAGPPGTGKTMCASVMARELDMELFRVDLSRVVSKWIGETERNLGKVFDEAQRSNAIILFDEADALFAKRTEVKSSVDRYANLEVNFLLQRMEAFGGVTILTTNFEDTIDTAFKRRLTFRLRFEKPDAEGRAALWRKMFPEGARIGGDVDFDRLGALYEMSGGNIRNAAVRSAFLAAAAEKPIDMQTCMLAAEREAREMGNLVKSQVDEGGGDDGAGLEDEPTQKRDPATPSPRLVPVTHPRR